MNEKKLTPEEFWAAAERSAEEVRKWPAWKRNSTYVSLTINESRPVKHAQDMDEMEEFYLQVIEGLAKEVDRQYACALELWSELNEKKRVLNELGISWSSP